jgi:hypothetical protein
MGLPWVYALPREVDAGRFDLDDDVISLWLRG